MAREIIAQVHRSDGGEQAGGDRPRAVFLYREVRRRSSGGEPPRRRLALFAVVRIQFNEIRITPPFRPRRARIFSRSSPMVALTSFPSPSNPAPSTTNRAERATTSRQEALHDVTLVRRFNAGDDAAFTEIISRYREKMFSVA